MNELRVIKRYANRKLYDTKESRYIRLPELLKIYRGDPESLVVVSSAAVTGEQKDITLETLFGAVTAEVTKLAKTNPEVVQEMIGAILARQV